MNTAAPLRGLASGVRLTRSRRREMIGLALITPWLIGLIAFTIGPILASLVLSFFKYNLISSPQYIGLQNYTYSLTKDPLFWRAVRQTALWAFTVVIFGVSGSLGLALLINSKVPGTGVFRLAFFIPSLTPIVAAAILWQWILQPTYGPLNSALLSIGLPAPAWFASKTWVVPAMLMVYLWLNLGGVNMIICLAALQNVPQELFEAAKIDGAGRWSLFRNVTIPIISPTLFYLLVVGLIGGLRVFSLPFMIAPREWYGVGGPEYATWFYLIHLYSNTFQYLQYGLGSALGWIFFIAVLGLTALQFISARRWVYYESEGV